MAVAMFYPQLLCTLHCLHTHGQIEIMYIYTALIVGKVANDVANLDCANHNKIEPIKAEQLSTTRSGKATVY